jgi:nitroreductase
MSERSELPFFLPLGEVIAGRRSVRDFSSEVLNPRLIRDLLNAAVHAPTAVHQEPWSFVVVQDREQLQRISDKAKPLFVDEMRRAHVPRLANDASPFADPAFNIFHNAGTLVVICGPADAPFVAADCWLAAENLMLAAHASGLGSCVIGSAVAALNLAEVKRELEIPASQIAIAPIIIGVPRVAGAASPRKAPVVMHWQ